MSRIWEALKQAERQRSAGEGHGRAAARPQDRAADGSDRRQSLRHTHSVPLLVYGSDAEKQPFHEEAVTIDANENGCLIALENVVARGQRLFLTNTRKTRPNRSAASSTSAAASAARPALALPSSSPPPFSGARCSAGLL